MKKLIAITIILLILLWSAKTMGYATVSLNGSASTDVDGHIVKYEFTDILSMLKPQRFFG